MLENNIEVDIPFEIVCTLRQACEFIAFGWEPTNNEKYESFLRRKRSYGDTYEPGYSEPMAEANNLLNVLFERGILSMTGIEDPGKPLVPEEYGPSHNEQIQALYDRIGYVSGYAYPRVPVIKPNCWKFDLDNNWVINQTENGISYRDIQIQLADLKQLCAQKRPTKHYTVNLSDDGRLTYTDGTISIVIANLRTDNKKYQWLKYYFDNPEKPITKQQLIDKFRDTEYAFQDGDRMTNTIHGAFSKNVSLMHACFPKLSDTEIICRPNFTDLDIKI